VEFVIASDGVFSAQKGPFSLQNHIIWGRMPQNPLKVGVNTQFQAKAPKIKKSHVLLQKL